MRPLHPSPATRGARGRADTCRLAAVPSRRAGRGWREGASTRVGGRGGLEPEVGGWGGSPGESVENRRAKEGGHSRPSIWTFPGGPQETRDFSQSWRHLAGSEADQIGSNRGFLSQASLGSILPFSCLAVSDLTF